MDGIYPTFGYFLILIKTSNDDMKFMIIDPKKIYKILSWSIISPPIIVPINMDILHINRRIPFANSGY